MRKRIRALVLSLCMTVSLMPITTLAAEGVQDSDVSAGDVTLLNTAESVCICETDDLSIHATNCPAYVAPENPECFCVEKCTGDSFNVWCDVCGIQGAEACTGEDMVAVYDVSGLKSERTTQIAIGQYVASVDNLNSEGWKWDKDTYTLTLSGLNLNVSGMAFRCDNITDTVKIVVEGQNKIISTAAAMYFANSPNVTISGSGTLSIESASSAITGCKDLSITDTTITASASDTGNGAVIDANGQLTLNSVDMTLTTSKQNAAYGLRSMHSGEGAAITITDSTVKAKDNFLCGICVYTSTAGTISIDENSVIEALVSNAYGGGAGTYVTAYGTVSNSTYFINLFNRETIMIDKEAVWTYTNTSALEIPVGTTLTNNGTLIKKGGNSGIGIKGTVINNGVL